MNSEELKCPWCGEEMRFDADSVHCWYKCDHCLAGSPKVERVWGPTKHTIANWDENRKRAAACFKRVPRWISVEERLPEDDDHYLVWAHDNGAAEVALYYGDGEWLTDDLENITRVITHWMPLPEPPDNEKKGGN